MTDQELKQRLAFKLTEPNKPMSDTPETDAIVQSDLGDSSFIKDLVTIARRKELELNECRKELAHQTDMASQADIACRLANDRLKKLQEVARRLHKRMETWGHVWDREFVAYNSLPPEVKGETK